MEQKNINSKDRNVKDIRSSDQRPMKKKLLVSTLKNEYDYISNLFNFIDRNHARKNNDEEDGEEIDDLEVLDIPETKIHKKQGSKKGGNQTSAKNKAFPSTIEGLEKELEDLKGTPMTYQKTLRKKGLQTRLTKKKRKENLKQQKLLLKQGKSPSMVENGPKKLIKPVLNSDGNVVSNKFDFAESDIKKENKRKWIDDSTNQNNKLPQSNSPAKKKCLEPSVKVESQNCSQDTANQNEGKPNGILSNVSKKSKKSPFKVAFALPNIKDEIVDNSLKPKSETMEEKSFSTGPLFNKDNKMIFSKVNLPENNNRRFKNKVEKDPSKLLQKLKEKSKEIRELEKEDKEKASTIKEKEKWTAALKRASGEKVRDDPELLRKSISKEKNMKARSQKKWQARTERVQKEKDDRQKKRQDNIQARKSEKKKKKFKKAVKKGSYVQI